MQDEITFELLGSLGVRAGESEAVIAAPRQRALLALLLVHANEVVSADCLLSQLWGRSAPGGGRKTLGFHVSKLRAALRAASPVLAERLVTHHPGYRLEVGDDEFDVSRFENRCRLAHQVRELAPDEALRHYDRALELWRGDPLAEFVDQEFAQPEIRRLTEARISAQTDRAEILVQLGRGADVVPELEALVIVHTTHERLWIALMVALQQGGRNTEALEAYQRARRALGQVGLEPSAALAAAERRLLDDDAIVPVVANSKAPSMSVPRSVRELVGRTAELALIDEAFGARRLVTLVGIGGVGKTTLALHSAHRLAEHFERVGWVDFAEVSDASHIPERIIGALGLVDQLGVDAVETLTRQIGDRPFLLVLDNCEHLADDVALTVTKMLARCGEVRILGTSRRQLGVRGERLVTVEPLAVDTLPGSSEVPAAVELFLSFVRDHVADFVPPDDEMATISRLCASLDGIPLALELTAARMIVQSPEDLLAAMERRLDPTRLDAMPEVAAVVAWSVGQLSPNQQVLLDRLSVFAGAFDLEAAGLVSGIEGQALVDAMSELVRASLVARRMDRSTRFILLETVRAWGRARLIERSETVEVTSRHAAFVQARLEGLTTSAEGMESFRELGADLDAAIDFRHAQQDFVALADLLAAGFSRWHYAGQSRQAYQRFSLLQPHLDEVPPRLRGTILLGLGTIHGACTGSETLLVDAITAFGEAGVCAHPAYNNLGSRSCERGELEEGVKLFRAAITEIEQYRCPESGGTPWLPRGNVGLYLIRLNRFEEARQELLQAGREAQEAGWGSFGVEDFGLAELAALEGDLESSVCIMRRRIDILARAGLERSLAMAMALAHSGRYTLASGDLTTARVQLRSSLDLFSGLPGGDEILDALATAVRILEHGLRYEDAAFVGGGLCLWICENGLVLRRETMATVDAAAARTRSGLAPAVFDTHWHSWAGNHPVELAVHAAAALQDHGGA